MFGKIKQRIAFVYRDKKLLTLLILFFVMVIENSICFTVLKDYDVGTNELVIYAIRTFYFVVLFSEIKKTIQQKRHKVIKPKLSEEERKVVAIHEAGHVVVSLYTKSSPKINKVSIAQNGYMNGCTTLEPVKKNIYSKTELNEEVIRRLAGLAAEKLFFGDTYSGVEDDLVRATELVTDMIVSFGMDPYIGLLSMHGRNKKYIESDRYALCVAKRANECLAEAEKQATCILENNKALVEEIAKALLQKETIQGKEVYKMFSAYQDLYSNK